jgi:serine protease Do
MNQAASLNQHSKRQLTKRRQAKGTEQNKRARAALGAVLGLGVACARPMSETKPERTDNARRPAAPETGKPAPTEDKLGLAAIAQRAMPAVVSVASTRAVKAVQVPELPGLPFDDPFLRRFFGPRGSMPRGESAPDEHGLGSGVIVDGKVILTNAHVVQGAKTLVVTAQGRRNLEVELAGTDPKSDLAVLRIKGDTSGLKSLEFADSDQAQLGQVVMAVGNPFGIGTTVTMGIISGQGRADLGITDYEDFIQTDAAINPGNSGGALVDMDGHLLGIPTAILSRTGGYMGVGFAIPANMARPIMQSLLATGHVSRGYLGVSIQDVNPDLAKALGLKSQQGVLIGDVVAGGPSDKAGLERGDVVLSIDGKPMQSSGQLRNTVAAAGVGKQIELEVSHKGQTRKVRVTLGAMPEQASAAEGGKGAAEVPETLGVTLAPLDQAARKQLNVPDNVKGGVVVTDVQPGGPAFEAGIRGGDVILELGGEKITSAAQLANSWAKAKGAVPVLLWRDGRTFYVALKSNGK